MQVHPYFIGLSVILAIYYHGVFLNIIRSWELL